MTLLCAALLVAGAAFVAAVILAGLLLIHLCEGPVYATRPAATHRRARARKWRPRFGRRRTPADRFVADTERMTGVELMPWQRDYLRWQYKHFVQPEPKPRGRS